MEQYKRVLITWSSSWLWLEIAKYYKNKWYEVVWISRTKWEYDSIHLSTSFIEKESIEHAVKMIKENYSEFSQIVCCAWIGYIEDIDALDYEHDEEVFKVNIIGQSYLLSQLITNIKKNETDIVFIGATIWYKANEFMPMYSVTKWWLRWMIENWRLKLKNTSCRVLWIHPWWMNTDSNIWPNGRETTIWKITGKQPWSLINKEVISELVYNFTSLPKNMEISEVIINRK